MPVGTQRLPALLTWPRVAIRWLLGLDGIPPMARPTFRYDLLSAFLAAMGAGAILPQLTGQFARRDLHCSEWTVALLFCLGALGNLFNTFLMRHMARERRVQTVVIVRRGISLFLLCLATLPSEPGAIGAFVGLLAVPYLLGSVIMNAQTNVRHSNYPSAVRGRIFSRLSIVEMATLATVAMLAGAAMDRWDWGYRLVFLWAGATTFLSTYFYRKIRLRRERMLLRDSYTRPVGLLSGFRLLIEDRRYGAFMGWQMLFGSANIMAVPILTLVMTNYLSVSYAKGMTALTLVPIVVMVCTAPLAGRLLDRLHVTRYRALGAAFWGLSRLMMYVAVVSGSWSLVLVGAAIQGLGQSVGHMAFNLGHMYFTSPRRSQEYMGIHMTLQGVRGLASPLLGILLLQTQGIGLTTLLIASGAMFVAAGGFYFMRPPEPLDEQDEN